MKIKPIFWVVIGLLLVGMGISTYLYFKQKWSRERLNTELINRDKTLLETKDKLDRAKVEARVLELTINQMQEFFDGKLEEIEKVTGEKGKTVTKIVEIKTITRDTLRDTIAVVQHDTIRETLLKEPDLKTIGELFTYEDEWAEFRLSSTGFAATFEYAVRDSITIANTEQRTKFLGPTITKVSAISHNPATRIVGLEDIEIETRNKKFGIGPQVGVSYIGGKVQPYVGLGVHFSIIKF